MINLCVLNFSYKQCVNHLVYSYVLDYVVQANAHHLMNSYLSPLYNDLMNACMGSLVTVSGILELAMNWLSAHQAIKLFVLSTITVTLFPFTD